MNREQLIAYHEAAHAVVAARLGILGLDSIITATPKGCTYGSVSFSKNGDDGAWKLWTKEYIRKAIIAYYAGNIASTKLEPGLDILEEGEGYELDMLRANEMGLWIDDPFFFDDPAAMALYAQNPAWKESALLVEQNWQAITSLAGELVKPRTVYGREVKKMLDL